MKKATPVPSYEVEFLPLERRLNERRTEESVVYLAEERRFHERRRKAATMHLSSDRRAVANG